MDSKVAIYWERLAIYVVGILFGLCAWLFIQQDSRIDALEARVQALQIEKVNNQELKDLEDRFYKRMEGLKGDIIDRIDWYFEGKKSRRGVTNE